MMDVDVWDQLLQRYVDDRGRVNYRMWQAESYQTLTQWLTTTGQSHLQELPNADEQLAFWLNLYNALAIAQVLAHYPIASIRPQIAGISNWIAFLWFFLRPGYRLGDRTYSLNHIEHGVLRKQFNEPRIHFALVCASVGCPLLRNGAYRAIAIRQQLEEDVQRFIRNPEKVRYDAQTGVLYCSQIFKWYRHDFLKVAPSIPEYISFYLNPDLPISAATPIRYLPYDWSLNQMAPPQHSFG